MRGKGRWKMMITAMLAGMLSLTRPISAAEMSSPEMGLCVTSASEGTAMEVTLQVKGDRLNGIAHLVFRYDPTVLSVSDTEPRINQDWSAVGTSPDSLSVVTHLGGGYTALTVVTQGEHRYGSLTDIVTLSMNVLDSERLDDSSIRLVSEEELPYLHHTAVLSLGDGVISDREAPKGMSPLDPEICMHTDTSGNGICTHKTTVLHPEIPAGCMSEGSRAYLSCSSCGKYSINNGSVWSDTIDSVIRPYGHKTEVVGARKASEHEDGYTGDTYCTRCENDISYGTVIPKRGSGAASGFYRPPVIPVRLELGMTDMPVTDTMHLNAGTVLNLDAFIPERTGYVFNGWYSDAACTKPLTGEYLVTQAATLYAEWIALPAGIPSLDVLFTTIRSLFERWISVLNIPL